MTPLVVHDVRYVTGHRGVILAPRDAPVLATGDPDWGRVPEARFRTAEIYFPETVAPVAGKVHVVFWKKDGRYHEAESPFLPVPDGVRAAFNAGEDWRPLVDYLIETYPDRLPWLAPLVARIAA